MARRIVVTAVFLAVVALAAPAQQPCNCPAPPQVTIDWLGALTGCRNGGAPCATPEPITFTATPIGRPFQVCDVFDWDFGDGQHSSQQSPTHTYNTPFGAGEARVILLITNCSGGFSGDAGPMVVKPLTALPTIVSFTAS